MQGQGVGPALVFCLPSGTDSSAMAQRHPLQNLFGPFLSPCARVYGAIQHRRRLRYAQGRSPSHALSRPTISVGNISWGGTGKTPICDWLLNWSRDRRLGAALLTRGYQGHPKQLPLPVTHHTPVAESGDEPLMLARLHPEASILVDPQRLRAAQYALQSSHPPDLFILDDGFQHIKARRDVDLVLLDADDINPGEQSNWNRLIPKGTWREPASALAVASALLIKAEPAAWPNLASQLHQRLGDLQKPIFPFFLQPKGLLLAGSSTLLPSAQLRGDYILVTAVGNADQVRATVQKFMGRPPHQHCIFPDHHDFAQDAEQLRHVGLPLLCTGKDMVKLEMLGLPEIYSLEVEAAFYPAQEDAPRFQPWLEKAMQECGLLFP